MLLLAMSDSWSGCEVSGFRGFGGSGLDMEGFGEQGPKP